MKYAHDHCSVLDQRLFTQPYSRVEFRISNHKYATKHSELNESSPITYKDNLKLLY